MANHVYRLFSIEPPLNRVLSRLGYHKTKTVADADQIAGIKETLSESLPYIHPMGHAAEEKIQAIDPTSVTLSNGLIIRSEKISELFRYCRSVSLIACTIGGDLEKLPEEATAAGEMTRAVVLDAIGSEAVEAFIEYIHGAITQKMQMLGYRSTMRFSPGYGDLPTSIQPHLLNLLEAHKIGLSCHPESFLLQPQKSVTAFVGWEKL
jgi:hypothetical protein